MKISVIIPIFNSEKYLRKCLDSILAQTHTDLEVLLINDGSSDTSPQICDSYALTDPRITVIHQENSGVSVARNKGLLAATGSYLGFIDSDDFIDPAFYETLLNTLIEHDAQIVECEFTEFSENTHVTSLRQNSKPVEGYNTTTALELLMTENLRQVLWNKIYSREVTKDIFFEEGKINEDDFWSYQVFGKAKKIVKIFDSLYFYRQHEESIMGQKYSLQRLDGLQAHKDRISYMQINYPELENTAIKVFCFGSAYHYKMLSEHKEIDPLKKTRKKLIDEIRKYNRFSVLKYWNLKIKIKFYISLY